MSELRGATIVGTGSAVPQRVITNDDLAQIVDTSDEWIKTRTGISERRIVESDVPVSELCIEAAQKALLNAKTKPEELDLIIVATITPDKIFRLQHVLFRRKLEREKRRLLICRQHVQVLFMLLK